MKDREHKEAKLLADAFHQDWNQGSAAGYAARAAAYARRRRIVRKALAVTICVVLGGGMTFFSILHWLGGPTQVPLPRSASNGRGYEIMSDDELLTALHDRPLLMVKKENNKHEIVLLEN
jgi:hypothetical protein